MIILASWERKFLKRKACFNFPIDFDLKKITVPQVDMKLLILYLIQIRTIFQVFEIYFKQK